MTGFYAWLAPTTRSSLDITNLVSSFEKELELNYKKATNYHVTLAYDATACLEEVAVKEIKEEVQSNIIGIDNLNGSLVFLLESKTLHDTFRYFRAQGLSWDYETFTPHLTFATGTDKDADLLTGLFLNEIQIPVLFNPNIYTSTLR